MKTTVSRVTFYMFEIFKYNTNKANNMFIMKRHVRPGESLKDHIMSVLGDLDAGVYYLSMYILDHPESRWKKMDTYGYNGWYTVDKTIIKDEDEKKDDEKDDEYCVVNE